MDIKSFLTTRRFASDKMQKLNLFETSQFFLDVYCLEPGQAQKPHAHTGSDKIYAVLEGSVDAEIGETTATLHAGDTVLAPSGVAHGITNRSSANASVLVFMAPPPPKK